ncbi:MAG: ATP-binding protein [Bdellovibrio sp.]
MRAAFALAFSFVLVQLKLDFLESYLFDLRFRLRPVSTVSENVEIILVDQKTVEHFKRIPGFEDHIAVLKTLLAQNPKAVVYVTPLIKSGESEEEEGRALAAPQGTPEKARELSELLASSGRVYQMTDRLFLKGESGQNKLPAPFEKVPLLAGPKTADLNLFAKDGVTRRVLIDYQGEPLGHAQLAAEFNPEIKDLKNLKGQFEVYETNQLFIDFQRGGSFQTTKFEDFIRQSIDPKRFEGKLILIGDDLGKSLKSYVRTPYSRDPSAMTLVEMQANMFDTFIRNSAPRQAPAWMDLLLTGLISVFTVHVVLTLRPLRGMGLLLIAGGLLTLVGYISFWPFKIMLPMAHPYLAIFLCYYFFIPYRLIVENRRSWEYQQKNRLLSQVEELKTNFISMMSHDLRTPIARIQGMTEVILKDTVTLSSGQREALDHIRSSNEDLLRFINSILNYARIESQGVELHCQDRDINAILEEVVKKHEFLAKVKHIQLMTECEPLFPIQVDPDLIRQVFSNLVENAIKYSPENSKVLITSEEVTGGFVRVQVSDQGDGIPAEDLPHIFMKFFRSRAAKSSPIKGSGLGLYLAQYFIQLHKGSISVESSLGQGSTFAVDLPLRQT